MDGFGLLVYACSRMTRMSVYMFGVRVIVVCGSVLFGVVTSVFGANC